MDKFSLKGLLHFGSIFFILSRASSSYASAIYEFKIPFGHQLKDAVIEGSVTLAPSSTSGPHRKITKDFYGADAHGFSELPPANLVTPLALNYVKLGGSLHATYNWMFNAYFLDRDIHYAYAPLIDRLNTILKDYKAEAMFEVNMLGWQPDRISSGMLLFKNTANANHAGNAIRYINGQNKLGLRHIMLGNEPFESEEYNDLPIPSADEYIDRFIEYAMALRSAQDEVSGNPNDIKLWGPELNTGWTGWQTNNLPDCIVDYDRLEKYTCSYGGGKFSEFVPYFLFRIRSFENDPVKNPKHYKMLDYLTIHYYPLFRTNFNDPNSIIKDSEGKQNVAGMLESVNLWDDPNYINKYDAASPKGLSPNIIKKFKSWAQKYYPNVLMGVTEFGIDSQDKILYHPIVRPLYLADFVARAASSGLDTLINSFLQGGATSNSWAMIDKGFKTNLYWMYSLFTQYFIGEVITTSDTLSDKVNSYAVKSNSGINLFLVNKDKLSKTISIELKTLTQSKKILEIELPAWSLSVLVLPENRSEAVSVHQFGAKEMAIPID